MGGFDEHQGVMGDWMLPSPNPSPRTFFASLLGEDIGSRSLTENNSELEQAAATANPDEKDGRQVHSPGDILAEQKMSSRGGLLDRRAARLGFNPPRLNTENIRSSDLAQGHDIRSPYLTIPQGLSPTTLLDSPVFLSNSLVQPSPTTGKFAMFGSYENKDNCFESINSSFTFKPIEESRPSLYMGATSRTFPTIEVAVHSENSLLPLEEPSAEPSSAEQSPPLDDQQDEDVDQRANADFGAGSGPAEDGYNWRKYGQKQVKGSDYPRSYFKCTHPNCPVKKKVERSHEGHITEIIYKGAHNHPKPPPNRRSSLGSSSAEETVTDVDHTWKPIQNGNGSSPPDWRHENFEYGNGAQFESGYPVDRPSNFSNDEVDDEDDRDTGSVSLDQGGEEEESESKRRKVETYAAEMSGATRAIREPRVVVQTTSEVDILDDGYRWRKYGQKVVKGNPNPRSYYKCTSAGCTVRKHVERASNDLKSVITTYEGKHNHDVPAARNSSHVNSGASNNQSAQATSSVQSLVHRPEPSQIHNSMGGYGRPPAFGSFSAPWRSQLGLSHGFGFGMNNQQGIGNFGMTDMGQGAGISMNPFNGQRHVDDMTFMLPKAEPKLEPLSEASSYHHQLMNMNTFPGGPQM